MNDEVKAVHHSSLLIHNFLKASASILSAEGIALTHVAGLEAALEPLHSLFR